MLADERWWDLPMDEAGSTYPQRLADEHDLTCLAVRYNSGRRISRNGTEVAALLESLVAAWPVAVASVALVGHSMGGLVARSAAHQAAERGYRWTAHLRTLVTLGSPHLGAPLERTAHVADRVLRVLPESEPTGRVLARRAVGIKDLRYGAVVEDDWRGHDPDELLRDRCTPVPLLPHVRHHWVATTITRSTDHPVGRLVGDGLVRTPSARGASRRRTIGFAEQAGAELGGVHHLGQVRHPEVYRHLAGWLAPTGSADVAAEGRDPADQQQHDGVGQQHQRALPDLEQLGQP
jgi:pimeloyl-ACP methyl ester carboxylesterase